MTRAAYPSRRHRPIVGGLLAIVAVALAALLAGGWIAGWRAHTLTTPSMGRHGQVGSLVISRPVAAGSIHVGDILVFHPPGRPNTTFIHRVITVTHSPHGPQFHTKGDINGAPDSWTLTPATIIGRAVARIPDVGYLFDMLPLLLLGTFIILLLTHTLPAGRRTPARILAGSILAAVLLLIYRPLVRVDLIAQVAAGSHGHAAIVPTGMLPVRVAAHAGTHADLTPGQVGTVIGRLNPGGVFRIDAHAHLKGWWWLLLASWGIPAYLALGCRSPSPHPSSASGPTRRVATPDPRPAATPPRTVTQTFLCFTSPASRLTIATACDEYLFTGSAPTRLPRPRPSMIALPSDRQPTGQAVPPPPRLLTPPTASGTTVLRATLHPDERGIQLTTLLPQPGALNLSGQLHPATVTTLEGLHAHQNG